MGRTFFSIIVWYETDLFYFNIDTLITVFCLLILKFICNPFGTVFIFS